VLANTLAYCDMVTRAPTEFLFNGRPLVSPSNIRLGWKRMAVANTLAYYDMATFTALKSFIVQAPGNFVANVLSSFHRHCLEREQEFSIFGTKFFNRIGSFGLYYKAFYGHNYSLSK